MSRFRIAHLSNPHFGTIPPGVLDGLVATLRNLDPDLILLTGDITQRARAWQFREAAEFARRFRDKTFIAVPGNHDIPLYNLFARIFHPYRGYLNIFQQPLESQFRHRNILITALNSTSRWRHVQGGFDLARVQRKLSGVPAVPQGEQDQMQLHILACHHPMDCYKPQDEKNLLKHSADAMAVFDRYGIDLIVGGHIHDPYVSPSTVRYPDTKRTMIVGVAGTCLSWRTRPGAPNSFNFIEIDTDIVPRLTITRYDRGADKTDGHRDHAFEVNKVHRFVRNSAVGWSVI